METKNITTKAQKNNESKQFPEDKKKRKERKTGGNHKEIRDIMKINNH